MPNTRWISPVNGIFSATIDARSRNPSSSRYRGLSTKVRTGMPDRRPTTYAEMSTTADQPRPNSRRLDPVMLAAAYCTYAGSSPAR